jgi:hypothetical protein
MKKSVFLFISLLILCFSVESRPCGAQAFTVYSTTVIQPSSVDLQCKDYNYVSGSYNASVACTLTSSAQGTVNCGSYDSESCSYNFYKISDAVYSSTGTFYGWLAGERRFLLRPDDPLLERYAM